VTAGGWAGGLVNVVGVSRLDDHLLLADAGLAMAMVAAGADRLVDLRGETRPPGLPVPIDHFPIMDLEPGQDEVILAAARHIAGLAEQGVTVGLYCQAGISRTSTVAIAYLLVRGVPLEEANRAVREARPQAMPALELRRSLERIAANLSLSRHCPGPRSCSAREAPRRQRGPLPPRVADSGPYRWHLWKTRW
jgi:hypothetical protein